MQHPNESPQPDGGQSPRSGSALFGRRVPHIRDGQLQGDTAVVDLNGSIIKDQPIQDMKAALLELPPVCRKVRLRFDDVQFFSTAALGSLITLDRHLRGGNKEGTYVSMSNMPPAIFEVFRITKLDRLFAILGLQCPVATFRVQENGTGVVRLQGKEEKDGALSEQRDVQELAGLLSTVLGVICKEVVVDCSDINTLAPGILALLEDFREQLQRRDPPAQLTLRNVPSVRPEGVVARDDSPMTSVPPAAIHAIRLPEGERPQF